MAKNKITYERFRDSDYNHTVHRFTGSLRQPTLYEANNYLWEHRAEINYEFGGLAIWARFRLGEEYILAEESKTLELYEYDDYSDDCPICGRERALSGDNCPFCNRPWE